MNCSSCETRIICVDDIAINEARCTRDAQVNKAAHLITIRDNIMRGIALLLWLSYGAWFECAGRLWSA